MSYCVSSRHIVIHSEFCLYLYTDFMKTADPSQSPISPPFLRWYDGITNNSSMAAFFQETTVYLMNNNWRENDKKCEQVIACHTSWKYEKTYNLWLSGSILYA